MLLILQGIRKEHNANYINLGDVILNQSKSKGYASY